jgi:uncharacterized protein YfiM (DUF2279 family)
MGRRAGVFLILVLLVVPRGVAAEDKWAAADKAKHFGAGAGIGAAAGKELYDRRHGTPSWRDFTWSAAGTAAGVFIAWAVDKARD